MNSEEMNTKKGEGSLGRETKNADLRSETVERDGKEGEETQIGVRGGLGDGWKPGPSWPPCRQTGSALEVRLIQSCTPEQGLIMPWILEGEMVSGEGSFSLEEAELLI